MTMSRPMTRRAAGLSLFLPALILGGCGSGMPEPITTPTAVVTPETDAKGNVKKVVEPGPAQAAPPFKRAR
jgi:hypothetical protein